MHSDLESMTPEMAIQQISTAPGGIALERWKELFLSHAIDKNNQIPHDRITAWNDLARFLDGHVTANDYYRHGNPLRENVEAMLTKMGDRERENDRSEINELLCRRISEARGAEHWKAAAVMPGVRMYIDAARLCNRDVIKDMEKWEKHSFPSKDRANYEADIQEKIDDAFDEAMLAPSIRSESLPGFVAAVVKRRLIDLQRSRLGRHESARANRIQFVSLDAAQYHGESRDVSLHDIIGADGFSLSRHKIDPASLVDEIREYAQALPEKDRIILNAYLEEKTADPKTSNKQIASKLGMAEGTLYVSIQRIMKHISYAVPVIHDFLKLHVLSRGEHSSPVHAPYGHAQKVHSPLINPTLRQLKDEVRALFIDEQTNTPSIREISNAAGLAHSNTSSVLMGAHNNVDPARGGALSDEMHDKLSAYLQTHGGADKVARFQELFSQMRKETGYAGRIRNAAKPTRSLE